MIIPNRVIDELVLAVPGMTYWEHIAAQYEHMTAPKAALRRD